MKKLIASILFFGSFSVVMAQSSSWDRFRDLFVGPPAQIPLQPIGRILFPNATRAVNTVAPVVRAIAFDSNNPPRFSVSTDVVGRSATCYAMTAAIAEACRNGNCETSYSSDMTCRDQDEEGECFAHGAICAGSSARGTCYSKCSIAVRQPLKITLELGSLECTLPRPMNPCESLAQPTYSEEYANCKLKYAQYMQNMPEIIAGPTRRQNYTGTVSGGKPPYSVNVLGATPIVSGGSFSGSVSVPSFVTSITATAIDSRAASATARVTAKSCVVECGLRKTQGACSYGGGGCFWVQEQGASPTGEWGRCVNKEAYRCAKVNGITDSVDREAACHEAQCEFLSGRCGSSRLRQ